MIHYASSIHDEWPQFFPDRENKKGVHARLCIHVCTYWVHVRLSQIERRSLIYWVTQKSYKRSWMSFNWKCAWALQLFTDQRMYRYTYNILCAVGMMCGREKEDARVSPLPADYDFCVKTALVGEIRAEKFPATAGTRWRNVQLCSQPPSWCIIHIDILFSNPCRPDCWNSFCVRLENISLQKSGEKEKKKRVRASSREEGERKGKERRKKSSSLIFRTQSRNISVVARRVLYFYIASKEINLE